jgi:hypothetical protein
VAWVLGTPLFLWLLWYFAYTHRAQPSDIRGSVLSPGIVYDREARQTPRSLMIHTVTIDLHTPGLRFLVTPPTDPSKDLPLVARPTSQFLRETGAQFAVNGDFFYPWYANGPFNYYPHIGDPVAVQGYASSKGVAYGKGDNRWNFPILCMSADSKVRIAYLKPGDPTPYNALSGDRLLLKEGKVTDAAGRNGALHPRLAAALDKTGNHLIFVLVDGRQPNYSEGVTMEELAGLLREKGGWTGLNFDGGGSATFAQRKPSGEPEVMNSPINWRHIPGSERPVANHLAIFAAPASK